jgi:alpha-galactosidase
LPQDACVEVPTFADDTGLRPTRVGSLPPQCAAACMTNVVVQQLCAEAALGGDPEHIVHALALDPLTAAVCTLKEIRDMSMEMLEAQREWLPEFVGKSIRPTPTISISADVKPIEVPLDPALAIHQRFGKLVSQKTQ